MKWFAENPHGTNPGLRGSDAWYLHTWGRRSFASNFARGGFSATAFAPTTMEAFTSAFRPTHKYGSEKHLNNLRRLQNAYPNDLNIKEAYKKAQISGSTKGSLLGRVGGKALGAGFVVLPMFTTPGGLDEKLRATAGGIAGLGGWVVGSKVGMGTGVAIGSIVPGLGTAIGAGVGWLAGGILGTIGADEGFQALSRIPDRMVQRERDKRNLDWVNSTSAFMTQSAHTMRQQSLQAMNRGLMNSRSILGREAIMVHS